MDRIQRSFGLGRRSSTPGRTTQSTTPHPVGYQILSEGAKPTIAE